MLRFRSLASGSSGNSTLIEASEGTTSTRVLVDCGLGIRQMEQRLLQCGIDDPQSLSGIFITHEHSDHIGSALQLSRRYRIPVWMSAGTWRAINASSEDLHLTLVRDGDEVTIGDLQIGPFTVPHDAEEPLQLRCTDGARSLGILTDLGHVPPYVIQQLRGCHALLLECNHDPDLLARSSYPPFLKRRVGGPHGHLNNAQAAIALKELMHDALHIVLAGHLSERNNRADLAQAALAEVLGCVPALVPFSTRQGSDWFGV